VRWLRPCYKDSNAELSEKGLLRNHEHGREVQETLRQQYPNEHHADCYLWALFRDSHYTAKSDWPRADCPCIGRRGLGLGQELF
jgi:hypothetical protein